MTKNKKHKSRHYKRIAGFDAVLKDNKCTLLDRTKFYTAKHEKELLDYLREKGVL